MVRGMYVSYIYEIPLVDIYYINWWRSDITHRQNQGKAPPPPVAKGAGKVAKIGGNAGGNHGFCFLSQSFLCGKKLLYLRLG